MTAVLVLALFAAPAPPPRLPDFSDGDTAWLIHCGTVARVEVVYQTYGGGKLACWCDPARDHYVQILPGTPIYRTRAGAEDALRRISP